MSSGEGSDVSIHRRHPPYVPGSSRGRQLEVKRLPVRVEHAVESEAAAKAR